MTNSSYLSVSNSFIYYIKGCPKVSFKGITAENPNKEIIPKASIKGKFFPQRSFKKGAPTLPMVPDNEVNPRAKDLTVVGKSSLKYTYTTVHTNAILNLNKAASPI